MKTAPKKVSDNGQIDRRTALKFDGTCDTPATLAEMIRWALGPYHRRKIGKDGVGDLAATIAYGVESMRVEDRRLVIDDMSPAGDAVDAVSYRGAVGQPDELVKALRANYAHVMCMAAGIPEEQAAQVAAAASGGLSARVSLGMTTRVAREDEDDDEDVAA